MESMLTDEVTPCDQPIQNNVLHVCMLEEPSDELKEQVTRHVSSLLLRRGVTGPRPTFLFNGATTVECGDDAFLSEHAQWVKICEPSAYCEHESEMLLPLSGNQTVRIHVFTLNDRSYKDSEGDGTDEEAPTYQEVMLPSVFFDRLWESLIFDNQLKGQLLDYIQSSLLFSDKGVDSTIVAWNRMMLFYGPPGTGKTSLCKALAQKVAIRLSDRYPHGHFIEINAHSLFSKWFSESGKLVMKMFDKVRDLVQDNDSFVFVMIDEVESLTAARKSALSGSEPSDAIRVVNALLTQIDTLKSCNNVLIMATSNITAAIDSAFIDRADLKLFIGLPSRKARYTMLKTAVEELMRVGLITPRTMLLDYQSIRMLQSETTSATKMSLMLLDAARSAKSFSGRTLRKLPFITHAMFLQGQTICSPATYLRALTQAIERQRIVEKQLDTNSATP